MTPWGRQHQSGSPLPGLSFVRRSQGKGDHLRSAISIRSQKRAWEKNHRLRPGKINGFTGRGQSGKQEFLTLLLWSCFVPNLNVIFPGPGTSAVGRALQQYDCPAVITGKVVLYVSANLIEARGVIVHHHNLPPSEIVQPALTRVATVGVRIPMKLDMLHVRDHSTGRRQQPRIWTARRLLSLWLPTSHSRNYGASNCLGQRGFADPVGPDPRHCLSRRHSYFRFQLRASLIKYH